MLSETQELLRRIRMIEKMLDQRKNVGPGAGVTDPTFNSINVGTATGAAAGEVRASTGFIVTANAPTTTLAAPLISIGSLYSSGSLLLGYNVVPYGSTISKAVVKTTNAVIGYGFIRIDYLVGIAFHILAGSVTAGNDASNEVARFTPSGALLVGKTAAAGTDAAGNAEINGTLRVGTSQLWGVGTVIPATSGTMTVTMNGTVKEFTPTGACTLNASGGVVGQTCSIVIVTSGTTSYNITFNSNFRSQGVLATGIVTGKVFTVTFVYDGGNWCETGRTTAM